MALIFCFHQRWQLCGRNKHPGLYVAYNKRVFFCFVFLIFFSVLTSQRANNSHWTLCSRWGSWKQNILYSESFSFFPPFPAAPMEPGEKASGEPRQGFFRLWSDAARTARRYSHVRALKVPLRLSDHQRFTATHAWLAESYVWAWSRRWYGCECGRVDLLWYFNGRHLMSVKPDGPSITSPAPAMGPELATNGSH